MSLPMKRGYVFWSIVVVLFIGVLLVFLAFSFDGAVQDWQHRHALKNIGLLRWWVTRATDWPLHVLLGLLFAGIAWLKGSERWTRIFLAMIAAGALAGLSAY